MKDKKSPPLKISNARKQFEVSLEKKVYKMYTLFALPLMASYICIKLKIRQLP